MVSYLKTSIKISYNEELLVMNSLTFVCLKIFHFTFIFILFLLDSKSKIDSFSFITLKVSLHCLLDYSFVTRNPLLLSFLFPGM